MNDTVYRKDVIKALEDMSGCYSYIETTTLGAITTIRELPSAQRTGRWIDGKVKHIKNGELRNVRECSECGSSYFVYDNYNSVDEIPKFCPNCGCAMKGEEE